MQKKIYLLAAALFLLMFLVAGCNSGFKIPEIKSASDQAPLVKVEITFEGGRTLQGYVRGLRLGKDSTVYAGGMSSTNLYDAKGNITGTFNYGRVLYTTVLE
ncbi:MAG: hypothetical protein ACM3QW_07750 [Ignavibacteriales bacterium]